MPIPSGGQNNQIFSVGKFVNLAGGFAIQSNEINAPLFWTQPKGALIDLGPDEAAVSAIADLRDFKMPPLLKM